MSKGIRAVYHWAFKGCKLRKENYYIKVQMYGFWYAIAVLR